MPNEMVTLPNIGGLCAQHRKVWLAPTSQLPSSNAANRRGQDLEEAK